MTVWAKNDDVPEKQDKYGIVVLEIDCDKKLADNPKLPRNSYIVTYMTDGVEHHDIIIGLKVNIFDCYYDSLGKGSLKSIEYTCLLYTSPSPRDYAASRMPSSA